MKYVGTGQTKLNDFNQQEVNFPTQEAGKVSPIKVQYKPTTVRPSSNLRSKGYPNSYHQVGISSICETIFTFLFRFTLEMSPASLVSAIFSILLLSTLCPHANGAPDEEKEEEKFFLAALAAVSSAASATYKTINLFCQNQCTSAYLCQTKKRCTVCPLTCSSH